MSKVVIIGDSHALAYGEAVMAEPERHVSPLPGGLAISKLIGFHLALKPFYEKCEDGTLRFLKQDARDIMTQLIGRDHFIPNDPHIYLMSLGNTTLLVRADLWQKFRPWRAVTERSRPLSDAVMRQIALDYFRYIIPFFEDLKAMGVRVASLEAPPVRRDEPTLKTVSAAGVMEITRISRQVMADALKAKGVPVYRPPVEAYEDGEGAIRFLRREYWKTDNHRNHHHANADFGHLTLPFILEKAKDLAEGRWDPND